MPKMPSMREHHCCPAVVARRDCVLVALRAAGLDDRGYTGVEQDLNTVREGEERVGGRHRAGQSVSVAVLLGEHRRQSAA